MQAGAIRGVSALAVVVVSCALPWDTYDPRLGDGTGGDDAPSVGGSGGENGMNAGGSVATTGGGRSAGGGGGSPECADAADGTTCGSATANDCDAPDSCDQGACVANHVSDGARCDDCSGGFCNGCMAGSCVDCDLAAGALTTVFANNGSADGLMFNLRALERIRVTGLSMNLATGFTGTVEVYVNPGGHIGDEEDASKWSLVFSDSVTSAGTDTATFMSLATDTIEIAKDEVVGFYVTTVATGANNMLYFTEGLNPGDPADATSMVEIQYGVRLSYPFTLLSAVKLFNGTIHYEGCE